VEDVVTIGSHPLLILPIRAEHCVTPPLLFDIPATSHT
jgi:hypothetical protein